MNGLPATRGARSLSAAGVGIVLGLLALCGLAVARDPVTAWGQIVALPALELAESPGGPVLELEECAAGAEGLRVRGRIDPGPAGQGPVLIAVTGADPRGAGQSVASGFAYTAGLGDAPGSFLLLLPWANLESRLAAVHAPTVSGVPRTGPAVGCPS